MASDEEVIAETWSSYWTSHAGQFGEWDAVSEIIFQAVKGEAGPLEGIEVLEVGSGTGRISAELAREGAQVTCLDIAPESLEIAGSHFRLLGLDGARFVQGSILSLPREQSYDIVWNAGVLEHFGEADQRLALAECLAVLKPGGRAVVLTPYARSVPYRLAKFVLERIGRWPYGREVPVRSLGGLVPSGARVLREYTISFVPFFLDCHKFVRCLRRPCEFARAALTRILGRRRFAAVDRFVCRLLGGYLLVAVLAGVAGRAQRQPGS